MLAHVVAQFVVMVVQVTFVLVFMLLVFQVSDSGYSMSENFHRSIHYSWIYTLFANVKHNFVISIYLGSCPRPNTLGGDSDNTPGQQIFGQTQLKYFTMNVYIFRAFVAWPLVSWSLLYVTMSRSDKKNGLQSFHPYIHLSGCDPVIPGKLLSQSPAVWDNLASGGDAWLSQVRSLN